MAARLKLESVTSRSTRVNTRRTSRFQSQTKATIKSNHGERSKALVCDASVYGCSLQCDAAWLRSGMFISISFAADWSVQAIVRWFRDGRAGVEFLRPISDQEARQLGE